MIVRLAIALVLLAPLPASAQTDTGSRLRGHPAQIPDGGTKAARARLLLERYAACVARRDPKRVATALDAPIDAKSTALANLSQGYYDDCLSASGDMAAELRMSNVLLRGALFADRVTRLVRRLTPEMIENRPLPAPATGETDANTVMRLSMLRFGDCVMRKDPGDALDYVAASASTVAEDKALAALGPALGGCIDAGSTVKMSRSIIESALAEAIYRAVNSPVASTQEAGRK